MRDPQVERVIELACLAERHPHQGIVATTLLDEEAWLLEAVDVVTEEMGIARQTSVLEDAHRREAMEAHG